MGGCFLGGVQSRDKLLPNIADSFQKEINKEEGLVGMEADGLSRVVICS